LKKQLVPRTKKWLGRVVLSRGTEIYIYDIYSKQQERILHGHTESISTVIQLKNGMLASSADDDTIRIWDTNSGKSISTIQLQSSSFVTIIKEVRDGIIFSDCSNKDSELYDCTTGYCIFTAPRFSSFQMAQSKTSYMLSSGHLLHMKSAEILLINVNTMTVVKSIKFSKRIYSSAEIEPGILVVSLLGTFEIWDIITEKCIREVQSEVNYFATVMVAINDGFAAFKVNNKKGVQCYIAIYDRKGDLVHQLTTDYLYTMMYAGADMLVTVKYVGGSCMNVWNVRVGKLVTSTVIDVFHEAQFHCVLY
jgi:WD40 repeat protein